MRPRHLARPVVVITRDGIRRARLLHFYFREPVAFVVGEDLLASERIDRLVGQRPVILVDPLVAVRLLSLRDAIEFVVRVGRRVPQRVFLTQQIAVGVELMLHDRAQQRPSGPIGIGGGHLHLAPRIRVFVPRYVTEWIGRCDDAAGFVVFRRIDGRPTIHGWQRRRNQPGERIVFVRCDAPQRIGNRLEPSGIVVVKRGDRGTPIV